MYQLGHVVVCIAGGVGIPEVINNLRWTDSMVRAYGKRGRIVRVEEEYQTHQTVYYLEPLIPEAPGRREIRDWMWHEKWLAPFGVDPHNV